jgi:hypothetical protein
MCYRCPHATERGAPADHGRPGTERPRRSAGRAPRLRHLGGPLRRPPRLDADQRLALLAEVGIAPDHWTRSDHHPTRALVDDLAVSRMDRANAYAALCTAEKNARRLAAPPLPDAPATLARLPPAPSPAPTPAGLVPPLIVLPAPGDRPGSHLARRMIVHRPAEPPPPRRPGAHLADTMIVDLADELRKKAAQLLAAPPASPRPDAPSEPPRPRPTPRPRARRPPLGHRRSRPARRRRSLGRRSLGRSLHRVDESLIVQRCDPPLATPRSLRPKRWPEEC